MENSLKSCGLALILVFLASQANAVEESSGRVRVLWAGMGFEVNPSLRRDPFFDLTPVLASEYFYPMEIIKRSVRVYMPRSYENLLEYDLLSFIYASSYGFTAKQHHWFVNAVLEEGKGLLLVGHTCNLYRSHLEGWMHTSVGDVLPIHTSDISVSSLNKPGCSSRIKVLEHQHPLMASLPWSSIGGYGVFAGYTPSTAKTGSEVLAELVPQGVGSGSAVPFMVWWDVGEGRSLTILPVYIQRKVTLDDPFRNWEYYPDFYSNLHLYTAGREIPQDIVIVHRVRRGLNNAHIARGDVVSMMEFISKFGGSTTDLDQVLREVDGKLKEIESEYLAGDFEEALDLTQELTKDMDEAWVLALKVKDSALLSIYLIEWTVLTSTSLVAGVLVWSLMVKRRLYAEVKTTRLARMGGS